MDRPFQVSRSTVQYVKRQLPYRENVAYLIPSLTGPQKDGRTKDQPPIPGKSMDDRISNTGSAPASQARGHISGELVDFTGQDPKRLDNLKLSTSPKDKKTRHFYHYRKINGDEWAADLSSRLRPRSEMRYYSHYLPFSQMCLTSSACSFPLSGRRSERHYSAQAVSSAVLEHHQTLFGREDQPQSPPHEPEAKNLKIRERLHIWETEYRARRNSDFQDEPLPSEIALAKHSREDLFDEEEAELSSEDVSYPIYERGDVVDLVNQRPYLLRGDMVELRSSTSLRSELAIFVRSIGVRYQYYTMSGKWIHQKPGLAKYCFPGFVDAQELDPLLEFLPSKSVPEALQNKLQNFENSLPRDIGSPLLNKMLDFWRESDTIFRDTAVKLGNAHKHVAHRYEVRHASLSDLAYELLPNRYLKDGQFPAPVLYALHRSLMLDGLGFRPQKWNHRITNHFEIIPTFEIELTRTVRDEIRKYQEYLIDSAKGDQSVKNQSTNRFLNFLKRARNKIQESRRTRKYTPYGVIGPASRGVGVEATTETSNEPKNIKKDRFDAIDWRYIRFIAHWAALRTVPNRSYLHGLASAVLRGTGMYHDTLLDQRVGWTFLQELKVIAPWENRIHFDMRLPSVMEHVISLQGVHEETKGLEGTEQLDTGFDMLDGLRKDWGSLPVYCIDDIGASEIDDGVSIEPADVADEYWIHVHVADPASMIEPRSGTAKKALSAMRTKYLPDRVIGMLPDDVVQEHLSLAPDRRCLTFSGRMNLKGKLLETKITPGVLHNIIYMTPDTLSTVIGETPSVQETVIMVGDRVSAPSTKSTRRLVESHEMTELDEGNLRLLHVLGKTRQSLSSARGSLMFNSPTFRIAVASNVDSLGKLYHTRYSLDPSIDLKVEKHDPEGNKIFANTVMSLMLLAGEVGARWCQERGIPVINRISQPHPDDPDPREYFRRVIAPIMKRSEELRDEVENPVGEVEESKKSSRERTGSSKSQAGDLIAPHLSKASKTLPLKIVLEYQRLLGGVAPSTTPGPHLHLGLDMFTRTTSPLRRYSDLLVHWQIEAALLEEARLGESLIGSTRQDYLPFKRDELDRLLPYLDGRERELNQHQRDAQRVWAMQLILRAWKFKEAPLPSTFELSTHIFDNKTVRGDLTYFGGLSATFEPPDWLHKEDILVGDVFEVELADLDIYNMRIEVKPLRRVRRAAERVM